MRKHIVPVVCAIFFCGGLFALHLAAQSAKTEKITKPLDVKMEECSERELLELKIQSYQKLLNHRMLAHEAGTQEGRLGPLSEARAGLADAEAELYRYTGEHEKFQAALQAKVNALRDKLKGVTLLYEVQVVRTSDVCAAEVQYLDALLEQKRMQGETGEPNGTSYSVPDPL